MIESHTGPGRFAFYGANRPGTVEEVHARRVDISTINPAAISHETPVDVPLHPRAAAVWRELGYLP